MINNPNHKAAIQSAQLRQMLSVSNVSLISSITIAAVLAYMLREVIASTVLVTWCFLMVLSTLLRAAIIIADQRYPADDEAATHARLVRFRLGVMVAGLVWGSAGFLLFPAHDPQYQMFLIFTLTGITAGGVVSFSADLLSAIFFSVSVIVPLMIRLFVVAENLSAAMGMATLLYLGFMIMSLRRINRDILENITLRLEAIAHEKTVEQSEERYRFLFENMLEGYAHCRMLFDRGIPHDFIYLDVNSKFEELTGLKDVAGKRVSEVIPGIRESNPELFEIYGRVALGGRPERFETYVDALGIWFSIAAYSPRSEHFVAVFDNITIRKQAEIALRRESDKNQAFLRNASDGIHILDTDGNIIEFSDSFCTMLGYRRDEMIGMNVSQWDAQFTDAERSRLLAQQLTQKERSLFETRHRRKDGTIFDVEVSGFPLELDGKPVLFNSSRDITARKQAEESLRESESRFRNTLENAPIGMGIATLDGKFLQVNRAFCEMFGYEKAELEKMSFKDITHPDDMASSMAKVQELMDGKISPYRLEKRYLRKDGQVVWALLSVSSVRDNSGVPKYAIAQIADITERKRVEMALTESEERLRGLYELSPLGIALTDMNGRYLEFNESFRRICGYTEKELKALDYWALTPRKYEADEAQQLESLAKTGRYGPYEKEYIRKDGVLVPLRLNGMLVTGRDGRKLIWSIVEDISESRRAEESLRIAATAFESQEGMMITDANRAILRVNHAFTDITGYTAEEVFGKNPRILKSDRQDANFYSAMWGSINRKGAWDGEIWNRRKNGEIYPEHLSITAVKDQNGNITNYVASLTDITLHIETEEKIKHLAFFDPLTRLPNRRLLMDRLQQALASSRRTSRQGAILFIDLDNFKTINDTLGHNIGDLLLQQVAQRLETCVREGDTVARLGGDEFVVVLEELNTESIEAAAQTESVGEKILARLNQPYQLAVHEYHGSPSIGAVLFNSHQKTIEEILQHADIAMYQAKKAGRNTMRFFDPQMQDSINARAALEDELHKALENRQFQLHYQIQVNTLRRPMGAEALIRWVHPERGLISPAQFMPLAEETGIIRLLGQWVLDEGCAQIKRWQADPLMCDLVLAVNVSAKQFRHPDFVAQVQAAVQRHAINPLLLKLELTESVVLENIEEAIAKMRALKDFGVRVSLDDFGTGYSSLSYLKRLPLDQIKIDQSFVRNITTDMGDVVMVRTIVDLGLNFEMDVVAEGVETEAQFRLLHRYGCVGFQGYLFGKPMPMEQFETLLKQG